MECRSLNVIVPPFIQLTGLRHVFTVCSGFHGIYDVEHFIQSLKYDVRIVESIPEIHKNGKTKKIKAFQVVHKSIVSLICKVKCISNFEL